MNERELRQQVRKLAILRRPGARSNDGHAVSVPCYTFQGLNQGWWSSEHRRRPDVEQTRIISEELAAMDAECLSRWVKKLPSDAVKKARGPDYDLGQAKARYITGDDDGNA